MSDTILKTEELRFSYQEETIPAPVVLDGVDLEIQAGSFVAVLGHNGSGKSTLAKHLNAILLPTGGKVYVDGIDTTDEDRLLDIRRTVGMVFQNPDNQIVANVVEEDVAFAPENLGGPPEEIRRRAGDAVGAGGVYQHGGGGPRPQGEGGSPGKGERNGAAAPHHDARRHLPPAPSPVGGIPPVQG